MTLSSEDDGPQRGCLRAPRRFPTIAEALIRAGLAPKPQPIHGASRLPAEEVARLDAEAAHILDLWRDKP